MQIQTDPGEPAGGQRGHSRIGPIPTAAAGGVTDASGSLAAAARPVTAGRAPLILVVDDEAETLRAISEVLRDAGYDVAEASSGFAALERARNERPDLVLLDLGLPEMNGLDVARLLNNDSRTAGTPVVAVTGSWLADAPAHLEAVGFAAAVRKPASLRRLVELVDTLLLRLAEPS